MEQRAVFEAYFHHPPELGRKWCTFHMLLCPERIPVPELAAGTPEGDTVFRIQTRLCRTYPVGAWLRTAAMQACSKAIYRKQRAAAGERIRKRIVQQRLHPWRPTRGYTHERHFYHVPQPWGFDRPWCTDPECLEMVIWSRPGAPTLTLSMLPRSYFQRQNATTKAE